jgi:hypothetical protein
MSDWQRKHNEFREAMEQRRRQSSHEYGGRNFLEARCRGGWRSDSVYACAAGVMRSIFQEEAVSLGRDPLGVTVGSND